MSQTDRSVARAEAITSTRAATETATRVAVLAATVSSTNVTTRDAPVAATVVALEQIINQWREQ